MSMQTNQDYWKKENLKKVKTKTTICRKCKGIVKEEISSKYKEDHEAPGRHELDCFEDYQCAYRDIPNPKGI